MSHWQRRAAASIAAALATATAVVLVPLTPAHAEGVVVNDGADASGSLNDIRKVRIDHRDADLSVRVNFPDLRKEARAGLSIYIDKRADRRGPEFVIGVPLFSGSDYALWRMKKWKYAGETPVSCDYAVELRWKRDVVVFTADRACFGDPDRLRVGMRMVDLHDSSHPIRDWMIHRREFSSWLAVGAEVVGSA